MEDRRRTRSQGLSEGAELIQWDSLQDPVRIEREHAEAHRPAREVNTVININERMVENSEIPQVTEGQPGYTAEVPRLGEISPNQQGQGGHTSITPTLGEISPKQTDEGDPSHIKANVNEFPPKEPSEVTDLVAMEEASEGTHSQQEYLQQPQEGE